MSVAATSTLVSFTVGESSTAVFGTDTKNWGCQELPFQPSIVTFEIGKTNFHDGKSQISAQ